MSAFGVTAWLTSRSAGGRGACCRSGAPSGGRGGRASSRSSCRRSRRSPPGSPSARSPGRSRSSPACSILIPAAVGMRGVISGATGARLGTSIAAGLFEVSWRRGGVLRHNAMVGVVLTLASSLYSPRSPGSPPSCSTSPRSRSRTWSRSPSSGGAIGAVLVLVATIGLAVVSFRRGYDLDAVATPVITAVGDMVTLPALFLATFLVRIGARERRHRDPVRRRRARRHRRSASEPNPAIRRTLAEMTGVLARRADPRRPRGHAARVAVRAVLPLPRAADPDPAVHLAGGSARRHPVLAAVLEAPARRHHPRGAARSRRRWSTRPSSSAFGVAIFMFIGVLGAGLAGLIGQATPAVAVTVWGTVLAGFLAPAGHPARRATTSRSGRRGSGSTRTTTAFRYAPASWTWPASSPSWPLCHYRGSPSHG